MVVASDSSSFLGKYRLHCGAIILLIMSLISLLAPYHVLSPVLILLMSTFDGSLYDISVIVISLFPLILFIMLVIGLIQAIPAKNLVSLVAPAVVVTPVIISFSSSGPNDVYRISFMSFNLILMTWIIMGLIRITIGRPPNIVISIAATIVVLSPLLGTFMYARDIDGYRLSTLFLFICIATGLVRTTVGRHSKRSGSETDNERYMQIYREHLKNKKSLKVNIIQCMTVGPPTVGKTSLKEQLLANNEENTTTFGQNIEHYQPPSSPVCENLKRIQIMLNSKQRKQSHFTVAVDNKYTWKTLSFDEEVIGYLKKMSMSNNKVNNEMSLWTLLFILTIVAIYVNCAVLPLAYLPEREIMIRNNVVSFETRMNAFYFFIILLFLCFLAMILITLLSDCIYSQWTKSFTTLAQDIVKEALQHDDVKHLQPLFDRTLTIYFRDCGGQPEFQEVLPALVSQSTLFLLVFNLSEGLDTQYKVTYKTCIGEVSDPYVSSFTVKQALLQCLASISSIGSYSNPRTSKVKSICLFLWNQITQMCKKKVKVMISKVIVIGTHKDKLGEAKEMENIVQHINDHLKNELKGTDWYSKDMIIPTENGQLILGVNTFNPNDQKKVKDLVNKAAVDVDYQLQIPVPWLALEFCIRKLEKKVMSLKECQHLAQECNITGGDEFNAALWFLHNKIGTVRYFKNVPNMRDIVITDPQLLFDIVTDLIVNSFSFGHHFRRISEHDRFRLSGRFTKHHLEQCEAVKEKLLSVEQVIAVLEHLVIIAPVGINASNEQEYFLPCVLIHASLPSTPLSHNDSDIPPLLITCHYTPRGIFSSLISRILLDGKDNWVLSSDEIYRNQVEFCLLQSGHIVTITNFFRFLEIAVKPPRGFRKERNYCVSIQHYVSQCLAYVRDQLNYTVAANHLLGFYCSEHNTSVDTHPAVCNHNVKPTYKRCSLKGSLNTSLLPKEKVWFHNEYEECTSSEQVILSYPQEPNCLDITHLDIVYNYLMEQKFPKSSWQSLGLQLGLYQPTLIDIDAKNRGDLTKCLQDCLAAWLKEEDKVTEKGGSIWSTLVSALNKIK